MEMAEKTNIYKKINRNYWIQWTEKKRNKESSGESHTHIKQYEAVQHAYDEKSR